VGHFEYFSRKAFTSSANSGNGSFASRLTDVLHMAFVLVGVLEREFFALFFFFFGDFLFLLFLLSSAFTDLIGFNRISSGNSTELFFASSTQESNAPFLGCRPEVTGKTRMIVDPPR